MPSATPGGVVTFSIKSNGSPVPGTFQVHAIRVEQTVNRIASATITVLDGNPSTESFSVSDSASFVPGADIRIEVGYDGKNTLLFSGIVVKQLLQIDNSAGPLLEIECMDKGVKMTVGRKSATYLKKTDSDVIGTLIAAAGLTASVSSTSVQLPELVQYYASDWDFMLARAEINSMVVSAVNGKVSVFDPTTNTTPVLTLTYGGNLFRFSAELNCLTQLSQVEARAWDFTSQVLLKAAAPNNRAGPGNLSSKTLSQVVGLPSYALQTSAAETSDELNIWAKAQMLKSDLSKITGDARFQGTSSLVPGNYVTLSGAGARFDGNHFVSSVRHDISDGNWVTEASLGLTPWWFVQENAVEAPPAAGLLPGIAGLFNATVKKVDSDPDDGYRILVEVALFNDNGTGLWARLANFYATSGHGAFFLPEVGDEVILGFLNQDPRFPVILGSVYSQINKPFASCTPNEKNSIKAIVTRSDLRIVFDDENTILTMTTPSNKKLVLDDKNNQIEIEDEFGNSLVMSRSGITVKSDKDITLQAGQNINIKGNSGVDVESAAGDVEVKVNNINETANLQYAAKGSLTAAVQGGTELTLKAAMVMIN
ncbi:MAG: type VI secretion system tip protein VgrG [Rhodocyclaceae bacterium]|nr:type VI secretion system tip protein VgrG [Rhodocyclaceae bacterium]